MDVEVEVEVEVEYAARRYVAACWGRSGAGEKAELVADMASCDRWPGLKEVMASWVGSDGDEEGETQGMEGSCRERNACGWDRTW